MDDLAQGAVENHTHATAYSARQAEEYDNLRFASTGGQMIHRVEWTSIASARALVPEAKMALEVGCGTGRLIAEFEGDGLQVDGVDASAPMLRQLEDRFPEGRSGRTILADATALPLPDQHYDFVYSVRLLNQLASRDAARRVIDEIVRVLKPSGVAVIEFMSDERPKFRRNRSPVRLRLQAVKEQIESGGSRVIDVKGAFLLGMSSYRVMPRRLLASFSRLDRSLAALLPRRCSRVYVVVEKAER